MTVHDLFGNEVVGEVGDELERHYTPLKLARLCLDLLPDLDRPTVLEPSVGEGAFVRAARERWPGCRVVALDKDPRARGLQLADTAFTWPLEGIRSDTLAEIGVDVAIGNWPFSLAVLHRQILLDAGIPLVTSILPMGVVEAEGGWVEALLEHPPQVVHRVRGRPFGKHCRCVGLWVWDQERGAYRIDPTPIEGWES